jgi:hypothetical protein
MKLQPQMLQHATGFSESVHHDCCPSLCGMTTSSNRETSTPPLASSRFFVA